MASAQTWCPHFRPSARRTEHQKGKSKYGTIVSLFSKHFYTLLTRPNEPSILDAELGDDRLPRGIQDGCDETWF